MKKLLLLIILSSLFSTCQKEEIRRLTKLKIDTVVPITATSVNAAATIIDFSDAAKKEMGFCYSDTKPEPTTDDSKKTVTDAKKAQQTTAMLENLLPNKTYYVRFYVVEESETVYSPVKSIQTPDVAVAVTGAASNQNYSGASLAATVNAKGMATQVFFEYGTANTFGNEVQATPANLNGTTDQAVSAVLTGLLPNTQYFYRVKAKSQYSTVLGETKTFTTKALELPTLTGNAIANITRTTATTGGTVNTDGGAPVTVRGTVWSTTQNPTVSNNTGKTTDSNGLGDFTSSITGLTAGTSYFARAYATNSVGTAYGEEKTFTTEAIPAPEATTVAASGTSYTSAVLNASVNAKGESTTVSFEYGTTTAYGQSIAANPSPVSGTNAVNVSATLSGLTPGTQYFFRVKAVSPGGTVSGNSLNFTTTAQTFATLTTTAISNPTKTTATSGGNISTDGGATITARGVVWSNTQNPTVETNLGKTNNGTGTGQFTSDITGLSAVTTYYVRAYATNSKGTAYGNQVQFTTSAIPAPTATTGTASNQNYTTATLNANVNANNESTTVTFEYGTTTAYGQTIAATPSPVTGSTNTNVSANLSGLAAGTTYHFRVKAESAGGISYGTNATFSTIAYTVPVLTTTAASAITQTTATSGGNISTDGGATVTARGVVWSATQNPTVETNQGITTNGSGTGSFTSNLSGLIAGAKYYIRVYATNSVGTSYGNEVSFTTLPANETVTDIDGNVYTTVTIGTQVWMVENLKTTHYRNGEAITNVTDNTAWTTAGPAYCWYNNDATSNKATYGALYNWFAVVDSRNVAPTGWHVPTDAEWTILTNYLTNNGYGYQGSGSDIAKSMAATSGWTNFGTLGTIGNDPTSNNSSGFKAVPGGYRYYSNGGFDDIDNGGDWWSSTPYDASLAIIRNLYFDNVNNRSFNNNKQFGFSIRCLKGEATLMPTLTTTAVSSITQTTATSGGNITTDGGATVTAIGVVWSTTQNPTVETNHGKTTDGSGTGSFTSNLTGLAAGTTYYVRAYATNSVGTSYGNEVSFTALPASETVTDADGNTYNTVTIGTQVWMKENLKTTKYADGTAVANVTDNTAWTTAGAAYAWYDNNISNKATYGALYNWYAVDPASNGNKNLCPTGWHVPSDAEWTSLTTNLGGESVAGGKLKEDGTSNWLTPNTGATIYNA